MELFKLLVSELDSEAVGGQVWSAVGSAILRAILRTGAIEIFPAESVLGIPMETNVVLVVAVEPAADAVIVNGDGGVIAAAGALLAFSEMPNS